MKPIFKSFLFGVLLWGLAASLMAAQVANVPPVINPVSSGLSIRENDFVAVAISATDPTGDGDGDTTLQVVWDFESDPTGQAFFRAIDGTGSPTVTGTTSVRVALPDSGGNAVGQVIKTRVSVSDGIDTSTFTFDIPVVSVNHAPELIVDQAGLGTLTNPILEGFGFGVNASQSRDPDGGTVKFFWSIISVSGPTTCAGVNSFVLQGYYGPNPGFVVPQMRSTPANPTRVTISVRVEDGLIVVTNSYTGYIASSNGSCVVTPPGGGNTAPSVSAVASPQHAAFNQPVTLTGTATDPGDTLTYSWIQLSATTGSAVVLSGSASRNATFTAPSTATFLTFRFTATDSGGLSRSTDINVQVSATGGGTTSGGGGGGGGGNGTGTPSGVSPGTVSCTGLAAQGGSNQAAHGAVPATYTIEGGNRADISVTGGTDPDNTTVTVGGAGTISGVTYQWDVISGGGLFLGLTGALTSTVHFDVPVVSSQQTGRLRVTVNDPVSCGTRYEVNLVVNPPTNNPNNNNPTASLHYSVQGTADEGTNPSAAVVLSPPVQIMLDAGGSTDPDGDSLTYNWTVSPSLAGVTLSAGTTSRTLSAVEGVTGNVTVTVAVNDGNGGNVSRAVTFQFQPPTDKPVMARAAVFHNGEAVAGPVGPGMVLVLTGQESSVVDGTSEENNGLTFLWQQTGGPTAFTRNLTSRDAEIVVEGITETTNLTFRLTARNGTAVGSTDVSLSVDPALAESGGEGDSGPLYFARVGFGPVQTLEFQTLLVLDNRSSEDADDTLIEFFDSDGQPLDVRYLDNSVEPAELKPWDSSQPFPIGAQSSRVLEFREAEDAGISFGWARITSTQRLRGSIRFQLVDTDSGEFLSDVGILSSPTGSEFQAAFRNRDNLAFAVSNPGDETVHVRVKVERLNGGAFEDVVTLPPGGHDAEFLKDFFTFVNLEAIREGTLRLEVMESGKTVVATVLITRDSLPVSSQSFARVR